MSYDHDVLRYRSTERRLPRAPRPWAPGTPSDQFDSTNVYELLLRGHDKHGRVIVETGHDVAEHGGHAPLVELLTHACAAGWVEVDYSQDFDTDAHRYRYRTTLRGFVLKLAEVRDLL